MNNEIQKKISAYRRGLDDSRVNTSVYSIIFFITVIIFLFSGVIPLSRIIVEKRATIRDLKALNDRFQTKNANLKRASEDLVTAKLHIQELYKAVPQKSEIEDYMVLLVNTAATAGYKQTVLAIQGTEDGYADLRVGFEGSLEQLPLLVEAIESLERITVVDSIDFQMHEGIAKVFLVLKVIYLTE